MGSPGLAAALLASASERAGLSREVVEGVSAALSRAAAAVGSDRAGNIVAKDELCAARRMLEPYLGTPGSASGRVSLACTLHDYLSSLLVNVLAIGTSKSAKLEIVVAKLHRYLCALHSYPIFRESSAAVRAVGRECVGVSTRSNELAQLLISVFGLALSPEDKRTLEELKRHCPGDGTCIERVLEACDSGDLRGASEAADGISNPQARALVQQCVQRMQHRQGQLNDIVGEVGSAATGVGNIVASVAALAGVGLSVEDIYFLKGLANEACDDAGVVERVLDVCSTGNLQGASHAADGISNPQTRARVQACIGRALAQQNTVMRVAQDVQDITGGVRRTVAGAECMLGVAHDMLGTSAFMEDLLDHSSRLYFALGESSGRPARSAAALKEVLGAIQRCAASTRLHIASAAANPVVADSCVRSRAESRGAARGGSTRIIAEAVLGAAFEGLFGGLPESIDQPVNSLSAVYSLVGVLENPNSTSTDVSAAVSSARVQVLNFRYEVSAIKENHFNAAANSVRNVVGVASEAGDAAKALSSLFDANHLFRFFVVLGIVLGAFACVGIPGFKDFNFGGVLSMIMLCAAVVSFAAAFNQTCRRSNDNSRQSKSPSLVRCVFYVLVPGFAFYVAIIIAFLRLVPQSTAVMPSADDVLSVERACILSGILCAILAVMVFTCFDRARNLEEGDDSPSSSVRSGAKGDAGSRSGVGNSNGAVGSSQGGAGSSRSGVDTSKGGVGSAQGGASSSRSSPGSHRGGVLPSQLCSVSLTLATSTLPDLGI
ncbi:hypothetical protein [Neorickettsia sp. 179522]|uniref:hypothetical protein n=1 Tax=Neorickettsia sp. 179522 TaxID=1714371 RepID=UPI001E42418F|nr:hypothetical protein [Neorickettsia sp. 179522]